ncbi:MAG: hypothetical protein ACLQNE_07135 [Thermoguttaceae bacterium]
MTWITERVTTPIRRKYPARQGRHRREIDVPDVVRIFGRHNAGFLVDVVRGHVFLTLRVRNHITRSVMSTALFEHASHGAAAEA